MDYGEKNYRMKFDTDWIKLIDCLISDNSFISTDLLLLVNRCGKTWLIRAQTLQIS